MVFSKSGMGVMLLSQRGEWIGHAGFLLLPHRMDDLAVHQTPAMIESIHRIPGWVSLVWRNRKRPTESPNQIQEWCALVRDHQASVPQVRSQLRVNPVHLIREGRGTREDMNPRMALDERLVEYLALSEILKRGHLEVLEHVLRADDGLFRLALSPLPKLA